MDSKLLRDLLVTELAAGRLSADFLRPAIEALSVSGGGAARVSLSELHEQVHSLSGSVHRQLASHIEQQLVRLARKCGVSGESASDLDGFFLPSHGLFDASEVGLEALDSFLSAARDRRFSGRQESIDEGITRTVEEAFEAARGDLERTAVPWDAAVIRDLVEDLEARDVLDEESVALLRSCTEHDAEGEELGKLAESFRTASSREDQAAVLDRMLAWRTDRVSRFLVEACDEAWACLRATVGLTYRFKLEMVDDWAGCRAWLLGQGLSAAEIQNKTLSLRTAHLQPVDPDDFARRFGVQSLGPSLIHRQPRLEPPEIPARHRARSESTAAEAEFVGLEATGPPDLPPEAAQTVEPPGPKKPSVWRTHLRPFFADNWYIFAGLLMLVAGCSIVAFYTWDRHWLWRYTLMPALLGGFTFGLAGLGRWLEGQAGDFKGTAASLRCAAIGLLPVNFMTVAFLADDQQVQQVPGWVWFILLAAAVYLALFGWGLRRWCTAVYPPVGVVLGGTLLSLNSLVILRPVAETFASSDNIPLVLGVGFYLGFLAVVLVIASFTTKHLTFQLADDKRVSWFVGGTLVITLLQVFAWVHASLGKLPQPHTYSAMMVMAGGLVLFVERRVLALREDPARHTTESFLGFALIFLGCLLAQGESWARVIAFFLAGAVWLYQARGRRHEAHQWIGLSFLALAGASIGLLEEFPSTLRPALGFVIVAGMHVAGVRGRRREDDDLRRAAAGMRTSALFLTGVVAVLGQWHDRSEPLLTAGYLLVAAVISLWLAHREDRLRLVRVAMILLALSLPYLGCVDLAGRSLHGNTMVFGIAILSTLWLAQNWLLPTRLTRSARSTVLWAYGVLAVTGMILRVVIERGTPGDVLWYRQAMDYAGPLLMTAALVFTSYFSRSLVPSAMAAVIVIVLFPELKARFHEAFSDIGWGTGIGSACSALGLAVTCFFLRPWKRLQGLGDGDRFLGRFDFPLRRFDHTLFTWPVMASVVFLICRTETWTLFRNLVEGMSPRAAIAIFLTGVTWTLLAAYGRGDRRVRPAVHLGWIWMGVGIALLCDQLLDEVHWQLIVLIFGLLLQVCYTFYRVVLHRRHDWVEGTLSRPTRGVLGYGSLLAAIVLTVSVAGSTITREAWALGGFLAAQLVWHGMRRGRAEFGGFLFALCVSLSLSVGSGEGWLSDFDGLPWRGDCGALLCFLIGVQVVHLLLEASKRAHARLHALVRPFQIGVAAMTALLCVLFAYEMMEPDQLTTPQRAAVFLLVVSVARVWYSGLFLLLASLLGYRWLCDSLHPGEDFFERLDFLITPWRLASFAASLAVLQLIGSRLQTRAPRLVAGTWPEIPGRRIYRPWVLGAAGVLACLPVACQLVVAGWREDIGQVGTSFIAAAALGLIAVQRRNAAILFGAVGAVTVGNAQVVRLCFGEYLIEQGLSEIHLVCLGLVVTMILVALGRRIALRHGLRSTTDRASMSLAGAVLVLLTGNYLIRHNLQDITSFRFLVSGALAYLAALAFRQVARSSDQDSRRAESCEAAYHFGLTVALWCAALLVPAMRGPQLALLALSLPIYYFCLRAELAWRDGNSLAQRYRHSAAALACLVLALYASRAAFQLVFFPDAAVQTAHYHVGSPYVIVIGLLLLRLHGIGGGYWLGFYGGLALMVGSFFAVTAVPDLRPFEHHAAAGWAAILSGHFWTTATTQRSPIKSGLTMLGAIDDEQWSTLRGAWGTFLLASTQILALIGILEHGGDTVVVAPLLLGAASIALHHGVLRRQVWYYIVAGVQVMLALHADFWVESYLDREHIVWVLLGIWAAALVLAWTVPGIGRRPGFGAGLAALAGLVFLHVLVQHPASTTGLWAIAILSLMALASPRPGPAAATSSERVAVGLLLAAPCWLAYFSQFNAVYQEPGFDPTRAWFESWPVLFTALVIWLTGVFGHACRTLFAVQIDAARGKVATLALQIATLLRDRGTHLLLASAALALLGTGAIQVLNYNEALAARELGLMCVIYAALAWTAWSASQAMRSALMFAVMEFCVVAFFMAIRRQLMLTTNYWTPEYDVWASLIVAFALTSTKQLYGPRSRSVNLPLTVSLLVLPVISIGVTLANDLGTNVALLVVGLHSLMFGFLGKDDRESPYNILAVFGFVSFVLIVLWSKLDLHVIHAYVIPVGVGILILLQLFRNRLAAPQRNSIRFVTVLAMLGSSAYYALLDPMYPVAAHVTVLLMSLLAMGLGGFLRVRMYLTLGFAGVVVSLASILYRSLSGLERSPQMTAVGILVLVVGAALVSGAIYYKTHREDLSGKIDAWRKRFGDWE